LKRPAPGSGPSLTSSYVGGHNVQIGSADGDVNILLNHDAYRIEAFEAVGRSVPDAVRRQPSRLLAARYRVVPFTGRERDLAELADWRDDGQPGVVVRLLYGPGGQGKTRLAARFAELSTQAGWTVVQVVHRSYETTARAGVNPDTIAAGRGLLLVVDYAERWPLDDMLQLVRDPRLTAPVPVRVLLLARGAGGWWDTMQYRFDRFDVASDSMRLESLADTLSERTRVFAAARDRFAASDLLDVADSDRIRAPEHIDTDAFRLVLTLHMAALAAVSAHPRRQTPPHEPAALSAYLLQREREYWQAMYDNQRISIRPDAMARAVFTAILSRPLPYDNAVSALDRVGIPAAGQVIDDHRLCYPPVDPTMVLAPLYPDRLGEDFLALQTPGHHVHSYTPDPWAADAVRHLLSYEAGAQDPPPWTRTAITTLVETARRWPHVAHAHLYPLIRRYPQLALAGGGATLAALVSIDDVDMAMLESVERLVSTHRHVDLDTGIAALAQRLTDYRLTTVSDPAKRAALYGAVSYRLSNAGRWEEAVAATDEAVRLYRQLAVSNPAFEAPLAEQLTNLGSFLSQIGRREEALAAATEAVKVSRRVTTVNPSSATNLVSALTNLSNALAGIGRRDEALTASEEAVDVCRRLAKVSPDAVASDFAKALNNMSVDLSDLGRYEEALSATVEAIEILRRLVAAAPERFEADLAGALDNLGVQLSKVDRLDDALAAAAEAVELYRTLADANPATFEPKLAMALSNLGNRRVSLGQMDGAWAATSEAVELYRRLADANPAIEPELAMALNNVGVLLSSRGHDEDAVAASGQAVRLYRRLAARHPDAFNARLAEALANLAGQESGLGQWNDALPAARDAVQLYRRLNDINPAAFESDLAAALHNFGAILSQLDQWEEAAAATDDAVHLYRQVTERAGGVLNKLSMALANLGLQHAHLEGVWKGRVAALAVRRVRINDIAR
jgi:tetratricopeptide (TPR) repeat protein